MRAIVDTHLCPRVPFHASNPFVMHIIKLQKIVYERSIPNLILQSCPLSKTQALQMVKLLVPVQVCCEYRMHTDAWWHNLWKLLRKSIKSAERTITIRKYSTQTCTDMFSGIIAGQRHLQCSWLLHCQHLQHLHYWEAERHSRFVMRDMNDIDAHLLSYPSSHVCACMHIPEMPHTQAYVALSNLLKYLTRSHGTWMWHKRALSIYVKLRSPDFCTWTGATTLVSLAASAHV